MKKFFNALSDHIVGDVDRIGRRGLTRLQEAVVDNDLSRVQALIKLKADVNDPGLNGEPPLHRALSLNRVSIATQLVNAGADVNLPDSGGQLPLHRAVLQGSLVMVQRLIDAGADVRMPDREGRTALHLVPNGQDEILFTLIQHGADPDAMDVRGLRPLHYHLRDHRLAARLLALGANPNAAGRNLSPFAVALALNLAAAQPQTVLAMLQKGADIDTPDKDGQRLIHHAARTGADDLFHVALGRADLTLADKEGDTALHALVARPRPDNLQHLLARAPDLADRKNAAGFTPLQLMLNDLAITAQRGAETHVSTLVDACRVLIAGGADANQSAPNCGHTLAHEAVLRGLPALIDFFRAHRGDLDARDHKGKAALHLAVEARRLDFVDRLLDLGADPDLTDDLGWTLLDRLAERGERDSPVVQRLIVAGGQYNKQLPLYPELMRPRRDKTASTGAPVPPKAATAKPVIRRQPPAS
jgi:ankyrin repeat protein